ACRYRWPAHTRSFGFSVDLLAFRGLRVTARSLRTHRLRGAIALPTRSHRPTCGVMGHLLHDWIWLRNGQLSARSYAALGSGGDLVVYDTIINDDRRQNAFGLLTRLNMLIAPTTQPAECCCVDAPRWFQDHVPQSA